MRKQTLLLCFSMLMGFMNYAQTRHNVLNAAGGMIPQSGGGFIEYSVGETAVSTFTGNPGLVTQGFMQPTFLSPYYILVNYILLPSQEIPSDGFTVCFFPNPVCALLTIETTFPDFNQVRIFDLQGRMVLNDDFSYAPLDCSFLPDGLYLVRLSSSKSNYSRTFKMIKQ